ncbi:SpoVG family protein [uncultured Ezakiella sp.]|mgnify:CR=1 FL=1|uniref:SpoVG family protein n=1 Tax=uncultured Ezakiella sp. TaxID=1637529 RepID=UPI0025FE387D|nr:SpoVG family protein [uncultured Ezakiella sp.]
MEITSVNVRLMENTGKLKAVCKVVMDDELAIHELKIIEGIHGLFIAMPSRQVKDEYFDIVHPVTNTMRKKMEAAIFKAYEAELARVE